MVILGVIAALLAALYQTTPTPIATPTAEAEATEVRVPFEVLTQEDLTVITGNVQRPNGMQWFNGFLYVVCTGDWTIYEVDSVSGSTRTFISGVRNGHALVVEQGESDRPRVWVPDSDTSRLLDVDQTRAPSPSADNLNTPWGITVFDEESFLITSLGANALMHVTRTGEVETVAADLRSPTGVAVDDERVYVANSGSSRRAIEWLDREAVESGDEIVFQPLVRGLQNVANIAMGPDGYLYFAYAIGARGVVGRVMPGECAENGGCDNDQVELILYTDLSAPLAGLTISDDQRIFVHTLFRPEIYWASLDQESTATD
ncbi:MAG: hypothetical protein IPM16_06215 [Chloroflexi bacterium]|nr:hypothetical protein [Chloroflexota bacterium]